jgi:hypothetical protein
MSFPNPHRYADQVGLALDMAVAAQVRERPAVLDIARRNLARWRRQNGGVSAPAHEEWERVLRFLTPEQIADFLVSRNPMAARLSQSAPFAGVLSEEERLAILSQYAPAPA